MPNKKPKILIVEDDALTVILLETILDAWGYEIAGKAVSGPEAIALAGTEKPDLALMDITLKGGMDGIEAAEQIQRNFKIPFIYITAYSDKQTFERARLTKPAGYITKPFEDDDLRACIETALAIH